jgi:hypothetical protein
LETIGKEFTTTPFKMIFDFLVMAMGVCFG